MSVAAAVQDPVEGLLEQVHAGRSLISDREPLHFEYIPDMILHRDEEQKMVAQALLPILKQSRPSNLLIYGKPGTGKTLVARKVLRQIQERARGTEFAIRLLYANAKTESTMYSLLVRFGDQMRLPGGPLPRTGLSISELFRRILGAVSSDGANVVLVIDEIDHLASLIPRSGKDVLYHMTRANERLGRGSLTLVGISNDLRFKERLDPRVLSSLSEEEILFSNYSTEQIREILGLRAGAAFREGAVSAAALNLAAAMAGGEHGDARRAIDLLRVAGEAAERAGAAEVGEGHIREAAGRIEEDKEAAALRSYPLHEKIALLAVVRAGGTSTGQIYSAYRELAGRTGQKALTQRRVTQMLSEIEMSGMISGRIVSQGMHGRTKRFSLAASPDAVRDAFRGDPVLADVL